MDRSTNILESIVWDVESGALVKIIKNNPFGETSCEYGVVVGEKDIDQLEMFPFVEVYIFRTQTITRQSPSALEILSRPSDEGIKGNMD